jgi:hypothetical protein
MMLGTNKMSKLLKHIHILNTMKLWRPLGSLSGALQSQHMSFPLAVVGLATYKTKSITKITKLINV